MSEKLKNTNKTSKELRKEYEKAILKEKYLENKIRERTLELCKRYPDLVIDDTPQMGYDAEDYVRMISTNEFHISVDKQLGIIQKIEEHIASLHPHQQGKLFGD